MNKSLLTYSIISFIIIFLFGFNFLLSLLGNILILLVLTPLLFIGIAFLGINSFKTKLKNCTNCGATIIGESESCIYCGSRFGNSESNKGFSENASTEIIEIEAEEVN